MSDTTTTPPAASTAKPVEVVDIVFLGFIVVVVILDTLIMAFAKIDATMLPIFASFATATAVAPLSAWAGYRYASSVGSKNKDDALAAMAQRPRPAAAEPAA